MRRLQRFLGIVRDIPVKICSLKERNGSAIKSIAMTCPNPQTFCSGRLTEVQIARSRIVPQARAATSQNIFEDVSLFHLGIQGQATYFP
jgi:hypothetical protein